MCASKAEAWRSRLVGNLDGDVLEIGIGTGENLPYYRRARHIWGVEPDAKRAGQARTAAAQTPVPVTIDVAPAEKLPYPDASFDHAVSSMVFCSVNDPVVALAEVQRVLRPGGILHMREHVKPENAVLAGIAHALTPLQKRIFWNCHLDRPTVETLQQCGWSVEILEKGIVLVNLRATPPATPPSTNLAASLL
jgi:ubiquinone/menaquinone biosynthesis C-methylase UbiE